LTNKYNKSFYAADFPDHGTFNWVLVKIIMPGNIYYHGAKIRGVLLHDEKLMVNGILFERNEFEIIDEPGSIFLKWSTHCSTLISLYKEKSNQAREVEDYSEAIKYNNFVTALEHLKLTVGGTVK